MIVIGTKQIIISNIGLTLNYHHVKVVFLNKIWRLQVNIVDGSSDFASEYLQDTDGIRQAILTEYNKSGFGIKARIIRAITS